uniref:apical junction component 1 homolog n=1 Tax=Myxine glutinosa TaxID=7769 RepID=UPI00358F4A98
MRNRPLQSLALESAVFLFPSFICICFAAKTDSRCWNTDPVEHLRWPGGGGAEMTRSLSPQPLPATLRPATHTLSVSPRALPPQQIWMGPAVMPDRPWTTMGGVIFKSGQENEGRRVDGVQGSRRQQEKVRPAKPPVPRKPASLTRMPQSSTMAMLRDQQRTPLSVSAKSRLYDIHPSKVGPFGQPIAVHMDTARRSTSLSGRRSAPILPPATTVWRRYDSEGHPVTGDQMLSSSAPSVLAEMTTMHHGSPRHHIRCRVDVRPDDSVAFASHSPPHAVQQSPSISRSEPFLHRRVSPPAPPTRKSSFATFSRSLDNLCQVLARRGVTRRGIADGQSTDSPISMFNKRTGSTSTLPVVQVSSSPRRYAALSLSENSVFRKTCNGSAAILERHEKQSFLAPSITITDNEVQRSLGPRACRGRSLQELRADRRSEKGGSSSDYLGFRSLASKRPGPSSPLASQELDEILLDIAVHASPRGDEGAKGGEGAPDFVGRLVELLENDTPIHVPQTDALEQTDGPAARNSLPKCANPNCWRRADHAKAASKACRKCGAQYCARDCRRRHRAQHNTTCSLIQADRACTAILESLRAPGSALLALARAAHVGFLARGRGCLSIGLPGPAAAEAFARLGLEALLVSPMYVSLREVAAHGASLGHYAEELHKVGLHYNPDTHFLVSVSVATTPSTYGPPAEQPAARRFALLPLPPPPASPKDPEEPETLILTPPPVGPGAGSRRARELSMATVQRDLRRRGVSLRLQYPALYQRLCRFVERGGPFPPSTIYPRDSRTGKTFMCILLPASDPQPLSWAHRPRWLQDLL